MTELAEWESFYIIVGPSAGALIGLQFVVLTLIGERPTMRVAEAGAAFITPMIVHYQIVLLLSAMLLAPWHSITPISIIWGTVGVIGFVYQCVVLRRMRKQAAYKPGFEDWLFYVVLPFGAYLLLALSAFAAPRSRARSRVRGRCGYRADALRGHPQLVGQHLVSRVRNAKQTPADGVATRRASAPAKR